MKKERMNSPFIFEKTKDGEVMYDVFSRLVKDRIIFLTGPIETQSASTIAATLIYLDHQDNEKPISLYLNSEGGVVYSGLFTILDTMNYIKAPIITVCIGEAYSAASVLLAAGTKGLRFAYENSQVMIHEVQAGSIGSSSEMKRDIDRINKTNERLMILLSKYTGKDKKIIKDLCEKETFLTAKEALDLGLIDKIIQPKSHSGSKGDDLDFLEEEVVPKKSNRPKARAKTK